MIRLLICSFLLFFIQMGTLGGNLAMKNAVKDFPSDVFLTFEALQVKISIMENPSTTKQMSILDFLKVDMTKKLIVGFSLPAYPKAQFIYNSYKIMPRAQNAHAYVNAAFLVQVDNNQNVKMANICFGGIKGEFVHATDLEKYLLNKNLFKSDTLNEAFNVLPKLLQPDWVLPDASPDYRRLLACGLFYKFLLSCAPEARVPDNFKSGGSILKRDLSSGAQTFETIEKNYPLTKPVMKLEALIQCAGEAFYMNDLPKIKGELFVAFVHATEVNSKVVQVDAKEALQTPGTVAFYGLQDIPGKNAYTAGFFYPEDEEIFVTSIVKYYNQPVGIIVAQTTAIAETAAKKVKVLYEKAIHKPVLATLEDVFKYKDYDRIVGGLTPTPKLPDVSSYTDVKKIEGYLDVGSQYHFTMEPQTTVCVPKDSGMDVYSATQFMDLTQEAIAQSLNIPQNSVQLQVARLGGGYGAKISKSVQVACACALACHHLNRPIRFIQTIESMMGCLGKRIGCHSDYQVQFESNGKITSLKNVFYEDVGCTVNESPLNILTLHAAMNCYETNQSWEVIGKNVKTDAPSHTWCRAPGGIEGIAMIETIMEHIAWESKLDPIDVRLANISSTSKMKSLLDNFIGSTDYRKRQAEIGTFNKNNRWRKRGLGVALMRYPIEYFGLFPAFVSIYHHDGTVAISHGGIEMGQGINTKVAQASAFTLGIPLEKIKIMPSDTFTGANSMVSGAGIASESASYAARKACKVLNDRLKPVKDAMPNAKWEEIVASAYNQNINLSAQSSVKAGELKEYEVWGLAVSEVEVDILTGNLLIKRVDILEDTGESISPLVDVGQVEGAFVMALGYWLTEQLVFNRQTGELLTTRTWNYKVPGVKDIPIDFRVNLLQKSPNATGFLRSKTTGEPAACLAVSILFGIRHAIDSARENAKAERKWYHLGAPTTPEHIVLNSGTSVDMLRF